MQRKNGQSAADEARWYREKQGQAPDPDEIAWQTETPGQSLDPDEIAWQREKQGHALDPDEIAWQREKQGYPAAPRRAVSTPQPYRVPQPSLFRQYFPLIAILVFLLLAIPLSALTYSVVIGRTEQTAPAPMATVNGVDIGQATRNAGAQAIQTANSSTDAQTQLYNQGKAAFDSGDWPTAITAFEHVDSTSPKYAEVISLLAAAYVSQATALVGPNGTPQDMPQVLQLLRKAQHLNPNYPDIDSFIQKATLYSTGFQAYTVGDWAGALTSFTQLYQLDPKYKDVAHLAYVCQVRNGDTLAAQGLLPQAKAAYTAALDLHQPDDLGAQTKLTALNAGQNPVVAPPPTLRPSGTPNTTPVLPTTTPGTL